MRTETIRWVLPLIHQLVVLTMSLGFVRSRLPAPSGSVALSSNIFLFLLAFRLVNALAVRTFFQPDEFFQSLEPAWQIAFGKGQGAWITWVSSRARPDFLCLRGANGASCRNGITSYGLRCTPSSSPASIKPPIFSRPRSMFQPQPAPSS